MIDESDQRLDGDGEKARMYTYDLEKSLPGVLNAWHDAAGCRSCGRKTHDPLTGHDGYCPVPAMFSLRAENDALRVQNAKYHANSDAYENGIKEWGDFKALIDNLTRMHLLPMTDLQEPCPIPFAFKLAHRNYDTLTQRAEAAEARAGELETKLIELINAVNAFGRSGNWGTRKSDETCGEMLLLAGRLGKQFVSAPSPAEPGESGSGKGEGK